MRWDLNVFYDNGGVSPPLEKHPRQGAVLIPEGLNEFRLSNVLGLGQLEDSLAYMRLHMPVLWDPECGVKGNGSPSPMRKADPPSENLDSDCYLCVICWNHEDAYFSWFGI